MGILFECLKCAVVCYRDWAIGNNSKKEKIRNFLCRQKIWVRLSEIIGFSRRNNDSLYNQGLPLVIYL